MCFPISLGVESFPTCCTYKRFLSSMYSHVVRQVGCRSKKFPAKLTVIAVYTVGIRAALASSFFSSAFTCNNERCTMLPHYKVRNFLIVDLREIFSDIGSGGRKKKKEKKSSENDQLTGHFQNIFFSFSFFFFFFIFRAFVCFGHFHIFFF